MFEMKCNSRDWTRVAKAVNMGIDSHLQAFIKSKFDCKTGECMIDNVEVPILIRRLRELAEREPNADEALELEVLATDIETIFNEDSEI